MAKLEIYTAENHRTILTIGAIPCGSFCASEGIGIRRTDVHGHSRAILSSQIRGGNLHSARQEPTLPTVPAWLFNQSRDLSLPPQTGVLWRIKRGVVLHADLGANKVH